MVLKPGAFVVESKKGLKKLLDEMTTELWTGLHRHRKPTC